MPTYLGNMLNRQLKQDEETQAKLYKREFVEKGQIYTNIHEKKDFFLLLN